MKSIYFITLLLFTVLSFSYANKKKVEVPLIPQVQKIQWGNGWTAFQSIKVEASYLFENEIEALRKYFPFTT